MISNRPHQANGETSPDRLESEQRNRELSILNTFAHALNTSIEIEDALQVALEGAGELLGFDTRLKPLVATRLVEHTGSTANSEIGRTQSLTTRELEVLTLVARGYTNKKIAENLVITERTVKFHVSSILQKLNASNRTEAVQRAAQIGIIEL